MNVYKIRLRKKPEKIMLYEHYGHEKPSGTLVARNYHLRIKNIAAVSLQKHT